MHHQKPSCKDDSDDLKKKLDAGKNYFSFSVVTFVSFLIFRIPINTPQQETLEYIRTCNKIGLCALSLRSAAEKRIMFVTRSETRHMQCFKNRKISNEFLVNPALCHSLSLVEDKKIVFLRVSHYNFLTVTPL